MRSAALAVNPHEANARARKVAALVAAFDQTIVELGRNPFDADVAAIAGVQLESADAAKWAQLAESIGIRPPSRETIARIVDVYRKRAAGGAL